MNYRHIFHAGNRCDVVKHATLSLVLDYLRSKDKPFFMLDTHAGIGRYDLSDERAQKTDEAAEGIIPFLDAPAIVELKAYYEAVHALNPGALQIYPGSPLLAQFFMRPDDRLVACEMHPEDAATLRHHMYIYPNIHTHQRDGYEALGAFLPPAEKRGLVLIDPPFEQPDEFDRLALAFIAAHRRWPQGIFMLWYPIKERPAIWRFHETLVHSGIGKMLNAEFIYYPETRHDQLNGSGLIITNPPWQLDEKLRAVFPALHQALQTSYSGVKVELLS